MATYWRTSVTVSAWAAAFGLVCPIALVLAWAAGAGRFERALLTAALAAACFLLARLGSHSKRMPPFRPLRRPR